jgi:hypothetical protein
MWTPAQTSKPAAPESPHPPDLNAPQGELVFVYYHGPDAANRYFLKHSLCPQDLNNW